VDRTSSSGPGASNDEYPPQLHAGQVGYGPNFGQGTSTGDKMTGFKEELVGKVKRDTDLVQHGHDLRTGNLQRREREEADRAAFPDPELEQPGASREDTHDQQRAQAVEAPGTDVPERDVNARENVRMV